jgi:hypothetical protein
VGTVVATLREGQYYSDHSGRSHVGIYISHDEYQEYLQSKDSKVGIRLFDQFNGNPIKERVYPYAAIADKDGKRAKEAWTDSAGNLHQNRVQWMKDGEEYFVVLVEA